MNPAIPGRCREIVMHLLEKEPDNRYQSAEGVLHDLRAAARPRRRLRSASASTTSRRGCCRRRGWWGASTRSAALRAAFERALTGRCRGVLVSGAPGVGKTALVNELRPTVTASDGWFVAGQVRPVPARPGVRRRLPGVPGPGRLLLAEPEDELAEVRERILRALGHNAGLATAVVARVRGAAPRARPIRGIR